MKHYNLSLPFDETFAWENFLKLIPGLKQAEKLVFYGFGKKVKFTKLSAAKVLVSTESLTEPETNDLNLQRKFERVFMSAILKDPNQHVHIYERSATKNSDWKKQIYRCTDPDCPHYTQAQFIIGKRAKCFKCGELTKIERSQMKGSVKQVVGLCCSKSKKAEAHRKAASVLAETSFVDLGTDMNSRLLETPEMDVLEFLKEGEVNEHRGKN